MAKKKSKGGTNPFMERFKNGGGPLIRAEVEGVGNQWVDPNKVRGMEYDPEVIKMGGAEYFKRFIHRSLYANGLGLSPENNFEWGLRTTNQFWCDPHADTRNFPLKEPGPGRVRIPVYFFAITHIRKKPFKWATFAVVEEVLRGTLVRYEEHWIEQYNREIKIGILDKLNLPPNAE
jgi:hypothetical protein